MAKVKITQVKSAIGYSVKQKRTLLALGIRKLNGSHTLELNDQVKGMINAVNHLIKIENLD